MIQILGLLVLPLIGVVVLLVNRLMCLGARDENIVLYTALATTALLFIGMFVGFQPFSVMLVPQVDFAFSFQLNGLSLPFMLLATVLPILGLWSAVKEIKEKRNLFYLLYMLSYLSLIAVFMSSNLISLFVFWEIVLVAFFFIIAFWGEEERRGRASMKFLIFTQFGSLTMLGAFILMFVYTGSFNLFTIQSLISQVPQTISYVIFIFILIAAIIKMPIFPLHSWLPDAHVTAPTTGSVLLAGVLLKLGGYIFLLFGVTLLPNIAHNLMVPLILLGVFTVIYSTLVASAQKDLKRLVAYSSIFYMGLVFIGSATVSNAGINGAVLLMVSHGFIVGMLFVLAGLLKEKTGTRDITKVGGLAEKMPTYAMFFVFAVLATLGVPGLSNFPGELLVFLGAYSVYAIALVSLVGVLIATNYYLYAVKAVLFGALKKTAQKFSDISTMDAVQLGAFSVFIISIGILPSLITNLVGVTI